MILILRKMNSLLHTIARTTQPPLDEKQQPSLDQILRALDSLVQLPEGCDTTCDITDKYVRIGICASVVCTNTNESGTGTFHPDECMVNFEISRANFEQLILNYEENEGKQPEVAEVDDERKTVYLVCEKCAENCQLECAHLNCVGCRYEVAQRKQYNLYMRTLLVVWSYVSRERATPKCTCSHHE